MIMNAEEARKRADQVNEKNRNNEYAKVMKIISEAVEKGKYQTVFFGTLKDSVKGILNSHGFKLIERPGGPNETDTDIEW